MVDLIVEMTFYKSVRHIKNYGLMHCDQRCGPEAVALSETRLYVYCIKYC